MVKTPKFEKNSKITHNTYKPVIGSTQNTNPVDGTSQNGTSGKLKATP